MSQQNQSIAEELQKRRAAKTRQEVEVSWLQHCFLLLCSRIDDVCRISITRCWHFLGLVDDAFARWASFVWFYLDHSVVKPGLLLCNAYISGRHLQKCSTSFVILFPLSKPSARLDADIARFSEFAKRARSSRLSSRYDLYVFPHNVAPVCQSCQGESCPTGVWYLVLSVRQRHDVSYCMGLFFHSTALTPNGVARSHSLKILRRTTQSSA